MAKLYFYYASMNAGKSSHLLQADFNYRERGMETMLWTAALDEPISYLAIGPVLRLRAFDNNQNHYSVGHGGYYSPQRSITVSTNRQR